MLIYIIYIMLATCVVYLSIQIANYVDLIEKKTNISGMLIGGTLLACVTSLPELFTSIAATQFLHKSDLVLGNILGSNLFNISVLLILLFLSFKQFRKAFVANNHRFILYCLFAVYGLLIAYLGFPKFFPSFFNINILSVLIVIVYAASIFVMSTDNEEEEKVEKKESKHDKLSLKNICVRFSICALFLVLISIGITYITDIIAAKLNLNASLAGAAFLGIATSLPELISTIQLVKLKNFNAGISGITGSNTFNFCIITIADLINGKDALYTIDSASFALIKYGVLVTLILYFTIVSKHFVVYKNNREKKYKM